MSLVVAKTDEDMLLYLNSPTKLKLESSQLIVCPPFWPGYDGQVAVRGSDGGFSFAYLQMMVGASSQYDWSHDTDLNKNSLAKNLLSSMIQHAFQVPSESKEMFSNLLSALSSMCGWICQRMDMWIVC